MKNRYKRKTAPISREAFFKRFDAFITQVGKGHASSDSCRRILLYSERCISLSATERKELKDFVNKVIYDGTIKSKGKSGYWGGSYFHTVPNRIG